MRARLFLIFFLLLLAALGVSWVRWGLPRAEVYLHARIQSAASARLGRPVRVGKLRLHPLFLVLSLEDVTVAGPAPDGPPLFSCRRWRFFLIPFQQTRSFPWIGLSFGKSRVEEPVLRLDLLGPSSGKTPALPRLPIHRLDWEKGTLQLPAIKTLPPFVLSECEGSAVLAPGDASVEARGAGPWGPMAFAGLLENPILFERARGPRWKAVITLPRARLEEIAAAAPVRLPGRLEGPASFSLTLQAPLRNPAALRWKADAVFLDDDWTFDRLPWKIAGRASLSPEEMTLSGFSIQGVSIDGTVKDPFKEADADLRFQARSLPLEALRGRLPWKALSILPWSGTADAEATVRGPAARPAVTAKLRARGAGVAPILLPEASADFSLEKGRWRAEGSSAGGDFNASSSEAGGWEAHLKGLALDVLARADGWGNVGGLLSADFAVRPSTTGAAPLAGGVLRLEHASWGDRRAESVVAYVSHREGSFRFHNKENTVDILLEKTRDGWALPRLAYTRTDGFSVLGEGRISDDGNALAFKAALRQGSPRDIPALLARYPDIDGRGQADVEVRGTVSRPVLSASLSAGGLRFKKDGALHASRGTLRWEKGALSLENLSLDDAWTASALRVSDGEWAVDAAARDADAALLSDVLLSSAAAAGRIDARLHAAGGGGAPWTGELKASSPALRWGRVSLSSGARVAVGWGPGLVRVEELSVETSSRAWTWHADARRRKDGRWAASAEGPFIGKAAGDVVVSGGAVALRNGRLGDGVFLEGSSDGKSLQGVLSFRGASAATLLRRADVASSVDGKIDGKISAKASRGSLEALVDISCARARWRGREWNAALNGLWNGESFEVRQALLASPEGGRLSASGRLPEASSAPLSLTVKAEGLPLPLLGLPASGAWSGEAAVAGSRNAPSGTFSWSAERVAFSSNPPFSARLAGSFEGRTAVIKEAAAFTGEGRWKLRPGARLTLGEDAVSFDAGNDLRNVRLGPLSLFGSMRTAGTFVLSPSPRLSLTLSADDLWINQEHLEGETTRLSWSPGKISFDAAPEAPHRLQGEVDISAWPRLRFNDLSLWEGQDRRLHVHGRVGTEGPWDFTVEGHGLEAATILSLADVDFTGEGPVDVLLTGAGSAEAPRLEAEILGKGGRLEEFPYDRLRATLDWQPRLLTLSQLELVRKKGYEIDGRGEFASSEDEDAPPRTTLLLHLKNGNLAVLKELWSDCRWAKGSFQGELSIVPGEDEPLRTGWFSLQGGAFKADKYLHDVRDLNVRLKLEGADLFLENVSARSGPGLLVLGGRLGLEGFQVRDYDLSLKTPERKGVALEIPQLSVPPGPIFNRLSLLRKTLQAASQGLPRLDITVKGPHGSHVVAGELVLDDTHFTYPPLPGAFKSSGGETSWWQEFWRDALWDVTIKTGRDTWYRNEYVNVHVDGDVKLRGPKEELLVDGKILSDQGFVTYLSQPFQIKRALFEVISDTRAATVAEQTTAYLSGEAFKNATTVDSRGVASLDEIDMIIPRARLGEIKPRFVSRNNPGLSSERVFQKMMGFSGQDPLQPPSTEEQDQLVRAGLVQLVGSSAGPFANRLARLFGIDMISAIYEPTSPTGDSSRPSEISAASRTAAAGTDPARLTRRWSDLFHGAGASAGVRLSDRIFGLYKFTVDQTVRNQVFLRDEVQVVGRVVGNLYIKFSTELDSRSILGQPPNRQALLEQQWRFGLPRRKPKANTNQTDEKTTP